MELNMIFNWYRIEQDTRQYKRDALQWAAHERLIAKVETAQQSPETKLRRFGIVYNSIAWLTQWASLFRS